MNLEELLKHPKVIALEIRFEEHKGIGDRFVIYAVTLDKDGWPMPRNPIPGKTLQEAVDKIYRRVDKQ